MPRSEDNKKMFRLLIFLVIVIGFSVAWVMFAQIPLVVIGQPSSAGLMQQTKEELFFNIPAPWTVT